MPQAVVAVASAVGAFFATNAVTAFIGQVLFTVAISAVTSKLFGKKAPGSSFAGITATTRSALEYHKIVYGQSLVSGPIVYNNTSGTNNASLWYMIALTGHEVESFEAIYLDDKVIDPADIAWTAGTGASDGTGTGIVSDSRFIANSVNALKIRYYLGDTDQPSPASLDAAFVDWTSSHRARGVAHAVFELIYDEDTASVWETGAPQNFKALIKGRKIYDPRLDSTNGGTGAHRYATPSTWAWSENPALCAADYLTQYIDADPASDVDWVSVIAAADHCDATVSIPDGTGGTTTEKRFTCNGALSTGSTHKENLDAIVSSMGARLIWTGGVWSIRSSQWQASTVSFTESDFIDNVNVRGSAPRSERFNRISGFFSNPDDKYQPVEFQPVTRAAYLTRDNSEEISRDLELPMTNSDYMCQRLAFRILDQGDDQEILQGTLNARGLRCKVGDTVDVTLDQIGYAAKLFRVVSWSPNQSGGFTVLLKADSSAAYNDPASGDYTVPATGASITLSSVTLPVPTALTVTGDKLTHKIAWTDNAGGGLFTTELWESDTNDRSVSTKVASILADSLTRVFDENTTKYYWVRNADQYGRKSDWFPTSSTAGVSGVGGYGNAFIADSSAWTNPYSDPMGGWYRSTGSASNMSIANTDAGPFGAYPKALTIVGNGTAPGWYGQEAHSFSFNEFEGVIVYSFVWRKSSGTTKGLYQGWSTNAPAKVESFGGIATTNPYGIANQAPVMTVGELYLAVCAIYPSDATTDPQISGIYSLDGTQVYNGTDYRWIAASGSGSNFFRHGFYSNTDTMTTSDGFGFTQPVIYRMNGVEPSIESVLNLAAQPGADGNSVYFAQVFQRAASAPATPTGGSYNFATKTLTPPSGWSTSPPATDGNPLYVSSTIAEALPTGTDSTLTWTASSELVSDGADGATGSAGADGADGTVGNSVYYASTFRRSASSPATPTGGSYNFTTKTLTPPSSWSATPPATDGNPLYVSTSVAEISGTTGTDSTLTWTAPAELVSDGVDGAAGADGLTPAPTLTSFTVRCDSSGVPKTGAFTNAAGEFKVFDGTTDVTESATFSRTTTNVTGTISDTTGTKGDYSVTAISADAGYMDMTAVYNSISITARFVLSKSFDGQASQSDTVTAVSDVTVTSYPTTGQCGTPSIAVGPNGTVGASFSWSFEGTITGATKSVTVDAKIQYREVGAGTWLDLTGATDSATSLHDGTFWSGGVIVIPNTTISGPTGAEIWESQVVMKKSGTGGNGTTVSGSSNAHTLSWNS